MQVGPARETPARAMATLRPATAELVSSAILPPPDLQHYQSIAVTTCSVPHKPQGEAARHHPWHLGMAFIALCIPGPFGTSGGQCFAPTHIAGPSASPARSPLMLVVQHRSLLTYHSGWYMVYLPEDTRIAMLLMRVSRYAVPMLPF